MFKKLAILIVGALLCLFSGVMAQPTGGSPSPLGVGDRLPDAFWQVRHSFLSGGKVSSNDLSSFRGKVLILDFWATFCSPCIANFPALDSLEASFEGKVKVLAVNRQEQGLVGRFMSQGGSKLLPEGFSTVTGDSYLHALFPHLSIPHYVVIDAGGRVAAVTDFSQLTREKIRRILSSQMPEMDQKMDVDIARPLFLSDAFHSSLGFYSIFFRGTHNGLPSSYRLSTWKGTVCLSVTNSNLLRIFETAAAPIFQSRGVEYSQKRLVVEVGEPAWLFPIAAGGGRNSTENHYSYNLAMPLGLRDSLASYMLSDLNRYSGYRVTIEKREMSCLVMSLVIGDKVLGFTGTKQVNSLFSSEGSGRENRIAGYPLSVMIGRLNADARINKLVVDETGYLGQVDLVLSSGLSLAQLKVDLKRYGMELNEGKRKVEVLVVRDGNNGEMVKLAGR